MHLNLGRIAPRAVVCVFFAVAYVTPVAGQVSALERKTAGGGITLTALYLPAGDTLEIRLTLDTHAGDLMAFDMAAITRLRINGEAEAPALDWKDEAKSSHHRSGVIRFGRPDGGSTGVTTLELVVRGVGGVPSRLFRWDLGKV
jgi:hypothetical protein